MSYTCQNAEILKRMALADTLGERQQVTSAVCKMILMHADHATNKLAERAMVHRQEPKASAELVIAAAGVQSQVEDFVVALLNLAIASGQ